LATVIQGTYGIEKMRTRNKATLPKIRLYYTGALAAGQAVVLPPEQSHYVVTVMRSAVGMPMALFNAAHGEWHGVLATAHKKAAVVQLQTCARPPVHEQGPVLFFAPLKKQRLDMIIEKAVELGAAGLVPVLTQHTVSQKINFERLQAQAVEAAEQSERLSVPEIYPAVKLDALLQSPDFRATYGVATLAYGDETGHGQPIAQFCQQFVQNMQKIYPENAATATAQSAPGFLIGPEGGFAAQELHALAAHVSCAGIALGPRILRAETACCAVLSVWQAMGGDWGA
jgi:16S rRNA (uracil1498-N3)-methyltransferase